MAKRRLLFTAGGGAGMEAIWRLWKDKYELFFSDADNAAFPLVIPPNRCNPYNPLPRFDLIVPGVDEQLLGLSMTPPTPLGVLVPSWDFVSNMLDKREAHIRLRKKGFKPPNQMLKKPRFGHGSAGIEVVEEILTGQEYTVTVCATKDSHLATIVPIRVDKKRGITIRGTTERNTMVIDTCRRIHDAFQPRATYNIQGFLTADNEFRPFEINPRVSTTLCLVIAAGIDPVEIFYDEPTILDWTEGIELRRTWHNEFIYPH